MKRSARLLKLLLAVTLFIFSLPAAGFSQWIIYNFSPRAAMQSSVSYSNNSSSSSGSAGGWSTNLINWDNSSAVGVLALQFTTNTNGPNVITALNPIVYVYSRTATGRLTTNNYDTNQFAYLGLTNTNTNALGTNVWFFNRGTNGPIIAGQYTLAFSNTNTVGNFLARLSNYSTNQIGTNGVSTNSGLRRFPPLLSLKILSLENLTNPSASVSRQLVLPLSINLTLTRTVNTNSAFLDSLTNPNVIRTNLPGLILSNSTYTNAP